MDIGVDKVVSLIGRKPYVDIGVDKVVTKQTRGIHPMLFQCWPTDAGPTLKQHWVNASC